MGSRFNLFQSGINNHNVSGLRPPRWFVRFAWSQPRLYRFWQKLRHDVELYDRDYRLVIDGFPRSGNSFAAKMLNLSQGEDFMFLCHRHAPPFFIASLELGIPCCLTLRNPEAAAVSWAIYRKLTLGRALDLYSDFHRVLLPYRTRLLVLNFTTLTKDFPAVLHLINLRFNLNLAVLPHLESMESEALERIDNHYRSLPGGFDPLKVARPHPQRDELKARLRGELQLECHASRLAECRQLYASFNQEAELALAELHPVSGSA